MNHLDLFSGIGGFALGLQRAGFTTVAFCEIEPYCQRVLNKHWPDIPIYEDIHHVTADRLAADGFVDIDIITGGYPCQPFSNAGQRRGAEDDRHLWPQIARLVSELVAAVRQPAWLLFENVAGHVSLGLDTVLADLDGLGYTGWPLVIPAAGVDAKHRRDRLWILAHTGRNPQRSGKELDRHKAIGCKGGVDAANRSENVADTDQQGPQGLRPERTLQGWQTATGHSGQGGESHGRPWPVEPPVGRVAHGIPNRVDRLRGLGNAVVPQIPEIIGHAIMEAGT